MNDMPTRATVLRFAVPIAENHPAPAPSVQRLQPSSLTRELLDSLAARDMAVAVHEADRFVGRAPVDVPIEQLKPAYTAKLTERASVALQLGDEVKRSVADEKAARAILRGITAGLQTGVIEAGSPLALIDITLARQLAKLALIGGLDYLAGKRV